jgi:hypothetical protein
LTDMGPVLMSGIVKRMSLTIQMIIVMQNLGITSEDANTLNVITLRCGSVQRVTMATESSATVVVGMIWLDTQQLTMLCINFTIVSSSVFSKK